MSDTRSTTLGWLLDEQLGSVEGVGADERRRPAQGPHGDHQPGRRREAGRPTALLRASGRAWDDFTGGQGGRQHLIDGLTTAAGQHTMLSVVTTGPQVDVGLIRHHMAQLVVRLGEQLGTEHRKPAPQPEGGTAA
ncbi:roadblock/LC7 domain-containing protein [Streptomyces sp. NPDC093250]|uniref:roadblock/LC7 domain-containing protein n=1 Tax=Streptomyces sp. NPDC093250 TaxID=3366036 RepID=UPI00381308F8